MRISTGDMRCGFLAAPGTQVDSLSAFGAYLNALGLRLPKDCSLVDMVAWGWLSPVLRVVLSRTALESWENFPELSMRGAASCPDVDQWTLEIWTNSVTSPVPPRADDPTWWKYFLDDESEPWTKRIRAHAVDSQDPALLPSPFIHQASGRQVSPWIDFFAYWQAYQVAELLGAASFLFRATPGFDQRLSGGANAALTLVNARVERVRRRWQRKRSTYEWLTRFRVILGGWAGSQRPWSDVEAAARELAAEHRLTGPKVIAKIRNVLLTTSQDWQLLDDVALPASRELRAGLRQDIEYALAFAEILNGTRADFLAHYWIYHDHQCREWAQLIDALPMEPEKARHLFPERAMMYLRSHAELVPLTFKLDAPAIRDLLGRFWERSRPLRRFCLAFHRLHEELKGRDLGAEEAVVRSNERIEQLLLTILNAEKVLVSLHRERSGKGKYRDLPNILRDQLQFTLAKYGLSRKGVGKVVLASVKRLMAARAQLHDLDDRGANILVTPADVQSGLSAADHFGAAFVNFAIVRNYAAHHDTLDEQMIFPSKHDTSEHLGHVALSSALSVVLTGLQLAR